MQVGGWKPDAMPTRSRTTRASSKGSRRRTCARSCAERGPPSARGALRGSSLSGSEETGTLRVPTPWYRTPTHVVFGVIPVPRHLWTAG